MTTTTMMTTCATFKMKSSQVTGLTEFPKSWVLPSSFDWKSSLKWAAPLFVVSLALENNKIKVSVTGLENWLRKGCGAKSLSRKRCLIRSEGGVCVRARERGTFSLSLGRVDSAQQLRHVSSTPNGREREKQAFNFLNKLAIHHSS